MGDKNKTKEVFELLKTFLDKSEYFISHNTNKTPTTINRYANGVNSITLDKLDTICKDLGIEFEIVFKKKK